MSARLLALILAVTVGATACSAGAAGDAADTLAERNAGIELPTEQFVLFTDSRQFDIRSGESIVVPVSLSGGGGYFGSLLTELDLSRLPSGITVQGMPEIVDLRADTSPAFYVVIAADVSLPVGRVGYFAINFADPDQITNRADSAEAMTIHIVEQGSTIGPVTGVDFVVSRGEVVAFNPIDTDVAGDAALDLDTVRLVTPPAFGTLDIGDDGAFTYTPAIAGGEDAQYQVCDTNGLCATGQIRFWTS